MRAREGLSGAFYARTMGNFGEGKMIHKSDEGLPWKGDSPEQIQMCFNCERPECTNCLGYAPNLRNLPVKKISVVKPLVVSLNKETYLIEGVYNSVREAGSRTGIRDGRINQCLRTGRPNLNLKQYWVRLNTEQYNNIINAAGKMSRGRITKDEYINTVHRILQDS